MTHTPPHSVAMAQATLDPAATGPELKLRLLADAANEYRLEVNELLRNGGSNRAHLDCAEVRLRKLICVARDLADDTDFAS